MAWLGATQARAELARRIALLGNALATRSLSRRRPPPPRRCPGPRSSSAPPTAPRPCRATAARAGMPPSDHCPACVRLARFALAVVLVFTAIAFLLSTFSQAGAAAIARAGPSPGPRRHPQPRTTPLRLSKPRSGMSHRGRSLASRRRAHMLRKYAGCAGLAALVLASPAYAHHPSGVSSTGGAGPIATISATTLEQGQSAAGVFFEMVKVGAFSDAQLIDFAGKHIHAHSLDAILAPSLVYAYGLTNDLTLSARLPFIIRQDIREGTPPAWARRQHGGRARRLSRHRRPDAARPVPLLQQQGDANGGGAAVGRSRRRPGGPTRR